MGSLSLETPSPAANGIHETMTREQYNSLARVNFSKAKEMARSPEHYAHSLTSDSPDTNPRKLGRVTHLAVLEPEQFASGVEVWEGGTRRGNAWEDFKAANEGKELVTQAEYFAAAAIGKAVRAHPIAGKYVNGGRGEVSLLWTHKAAAAAGLPAWDLDCKARLDYLAPTFIADLKVVRDASPDGFGRACCNYRTFTQAAVYHDAVLALTGKSLPYYLLAVESSPPYVVQPYVVTEDVLAFGREEYSNWFSRINACRRDRLWPGYAEGVLALTLPRWAMPDDDETDIAEAGLIFPEE